MRAICIAILALAASAALVVPAGANAAGRCSITHHADCARADLRGRDLHGAALHHATLHHAVLRGANLHHANLRGAVLHHADLRGAVLHHVDLRGADLDYADLRGVDLRHADLRGAHLHGAKLHNRPTRRNRATPSCTPDSCAGADLSYADLSGALLNFTNLSYARLVGANLQGAQLRSADLAHADLSDANLASTDFTGALDCSTAVPAGVLADRGCAGDSSSPPTCYQYVPYSATTGTFTVNANYYNMQWAATIPNNDTQITSLAVEAWVNNTAIPITSTSRSFTVGFTGASTGSWSQNLSGLQAPWSTNSGSTHRTLTWDVADTGYDAEGEGRIRVTGAGTVSTWTNPDQRISVIVHITGTARVQTDCS